MTHKRNKKFGPSEYSRRELIAVIRDLYKLARHPSTELTNKVMSILTEDQIRELENEKLRQDHETRYSGE